VAPIGRDLTMLRSRACRLALQVDGRFAVVEPLRTTGSGAACPVPSYMVVLDRIRSPGKAL